MTPLTNDAQNYLVYLNVSFTNPPFKLKLKFLTKKRKKCCKNQTINKLAIRNWNFSPIRINFHKKKNFNFVSRCLFNVLVSNCWRIIKEKTVASNHIFWNLNFFNAKKFTKLVKNLMQNFIKLPNKKKKNF